MRLGFSLFTALLAAAPLSRAAAAPADSVILFIGDGMGPSVVTAARIYRYGETGKLHMESLEHTARIRTHSRNAQTTDSAAAMSAYMTGVKTNNRVLSMSAETQPLQDGCSSRNGTPVPTLLELAKAQGYATGVVTTAAITDATPAATYAHICHRDLENEIAVQAVPGGVGYNAVLRDGVDVLLGGGRERFLPAGTAESVRTDGRDLVAELGGQGYRYVSDASSLAEVRGSGKVLGLFTAGHMNYDLDRDGQKEPSLAEMTSKAIEVLRENPRGYFLMVEGGRIDHALHGTNAIRALQDTVAFDDAIQVALNKVDLSRTLVVVTADHDHTMVINGHSRRQGRTVVDSSTGKVQVAGILGIVQENAAGTPALDAEQMPYSVLGFGNGEHRVSGPRRSAPALTDETTSSRDYQQEAAVRRPSGAETHGSGDVMLLATGAYSQSFHGTMDNTRVFTLLRQALGL